MATVPDRGGWPVHKDDSVLYGLDYGTYRTATVIGDLGDNRFRIRLDPPDPRAKRREPDPRDSFIPQAGGGDEVDLQPVEIEVAGDEFYVFRASGLRPPDLPRFSDW